MRSQENLGQSMLITNKQTVIMIAADFPHKLVKLALLPREVRESRVTTAHVTLTTVNVMIVAAITVVS